MPSKAPKGWRDNYMTNSGPMGTCPVCGHGFGANDTAYSLKDCSCRPGPCGHGWHYEHPWCFGTQQDRPAGDAPEVRMFDVPLWPDVNLLVTAISDGRLLSARIETSP